MTSMWEYRVGVEREMSKEDIKSAPDFNDQDRHARDRYDTYYEPFGRRR